MKRILNTGLWDKQVVAKVKVGQPKTCQAKRGDYVPDAYKTDLQIGFNNGFGIWSPYPTLVYQVAEVQRGRSAPTEPDDVDYATPWP